MSDKPKVYQGVRVKATVKELLQKQRAMKEPVKTEKISPNSAIQDICSTSFPAHHFDDCKGNSIQDHSFQTRYYSDVCNLPMETTAFDNQQPVNTMLPPENLISGIPHSASSSQSWSHGHYPSNSDFYNHGMDPSSPPDSLNLPSPADYNDYSPSHCYSSSSSCYSSPTRMDSVYGLVPENYHCQHCNLQPCYCWSHWSGIHEAVTNPEYAQYGTSDCLYTSAMEESYFRRELNSAETCYL